MNESSSNRYISQVRILRRVKVTAGILAMVLCLFSIFFWNGTPILMQKASTTSENASRIGFDRLTEEARELVARNRPAHSIVKAMAASCIQPASPEPFEITGDAMRLMGQDDAARRFYDEAIRMSTSGNIESLKQKRNRDLRRVDQILSAYHLLKSQDYSEAIDPMKIASEANPDRTDLKEALASLYVMAGRLDHARDVLTTMSSPDSKDQEAGTKTLSAVIQIMAACRVPKGVRQSPSSEHLAIGRAASGTDR